MAQGTKWVINATESFVWEDLWVKQTREFSDEVTRQRRSIRKLENLNRLGIQLQAGQRVADLGSGTGGLALLLRQQFEGRPCQITCVEKSPTAAGKLRARLAEIPSIVVLEEDVCATSLPSGDCDIVLAISILEHVQSDGELMREIWRVLKPGGVLYLCQSNKWSANCIDWLVRKRLGRWPYGYQKYYSIAELKSYLEPGFEVEECLISFPDSQAAFYLLVDRLIHFFLPAWGRNIFLRARKRENEPVALRR